MANKYDDADGVWRTIGGRRVFIRNGQSLSEAMIESGKFKNLRSDYKKAKEEEDKSKNITASEIDELKEYAKKLDIDKLDKKAMELYEKDDEKGFEKFSDDELKELAKLCQITEDNPGGRAYDDEVFEEMDNRGLSLNEAKGDEVKLPSGEIVKNGDSINYEGKNEPKLYEGVEVKDGKVYYGGYEIDQDRIIGVDKEATEQYKEYKDRLNNSLGKKTNIKSGNPLESMANERVKEKQDLLETQKMFLENMKKNNMDKLPDGTTQEDLEFQIWDNQNYIDRATDNYENLKKNTMSDAEREKYMKDNGLTMFTSRDEFNYLKNKQQDANSNWRDEIAKNNEQLEKDLEEYKNTHDMARESEGYYELFRENERKNAKIKQEAPDEKYEFVEAYAGYRDKRDKLEGIERDANGNVDWDKAKDATWTGKEYTNDEFLENLEDENWHTERKMLLDAGLTNKQMEFVKNNTEFHNGSPSLDREITEELIKGAKGEKYRTPKEILETRKTNEISKLQKDLDNASKNGTSGTTSNYSTMKERYKNLTGKDYDDSNVKIPYDPKKTYTYSNGVKIDQKLMQERYSGKTPEQVKRDIEHNKDFLMNYNPQDRELHNAEIKEMEKYYNSMEKYNSRISDDFTTSDWKEGYGQGAWKGSKSNSGLYGKDKIKAIDDEIKKAYPEIKTSRKTGRGGYTDHFSYNVMESDKPLIRSIDDFSDSEINRLYNSGYNQNYYKTKEDFKENLRKELEKGYMDVNQYNIDDDYRLTPYGKQVMKDIVKVSDAYNYDESDGQTDYFHTGHYFNLGIGKYDKPYTIRATKATNAKMNDLIRGKKKKN